jgi:hypothetical protein
MRTNLTAAITADFLISDFKVIQLDGLVTVEIVFEFFFHPNIKCGFRGVGNPPDYFYYASIFDYQFTVFENVIRFGEHGFAVRLVSIYGNISRCANAK